MKKIIDEYQFSPQQLNEVERLSQTLGIQKITASILYARGMDTEEKMREFLSPSEARLLPPELMSGMSEAVELLTQARDEGWNVAVFGDYDADGIGASSILYRALVEFGIQPYLYVPERSEGYGMSIAAIDKIFDEFMPDLFVTVDCGISNAKEVEYIKEQGAFVIVTDHHELPEVLPNCLCINPKIADDYPYDNLCGAGVALKLAQALLGKKANELLDICALSTVADSVPLLGENRDIVFAGLQRINNHPRSAFSALLGSADEVTAQTLAFTVAPRVNAAGRMGDAHAALRLFTSDDEEEIALLAEKLNLYNSERQKLCDELYEVAKEGIRQRGAYGNIVMAMGEGWQTGLVGIVAARIAEEFSRPSLLFVKNGDMLRGSARSIENINIYEALKACSQYIEEFGGHSQAAGVNIKVENFEKLQAALDEYLEEHYAEEDFTPTVYRSAELMGGEYRALAKELNLLEPFGVGNRRPLFTIRAEELRVAPLKANSPHLTISAGNNDFMYFGGAKQMKLLRSGIEKRLVFDFNFSKYRGREYLKGYIRSVVYEASLNELSAYSLENAALSLVNGKQKDMKLLQERELNELIGEKRKKRYGLCVIAYRKETLKNFPAAHGLVSEAFAPSSGGAQNTLLVAPDPECDLSAYRDIVFLETPPAVRMQTGNAAVYANASQKVFTPELKLFLPRERMLSVYAAIKESGAIEGESCSEAAKNCRFGGVTQSELIFAFAVFLELGLVERDGGYFHVVRGQKADLEQSKIYTGIRSAEGGEN